MRANRYAIISPTGRVMIGRYNHSCRRAVLRKNKKKNDEEFTRIVPVSACSPGQMAPAKRKSGAEVLADLKGGA